jgi:undecaprenyl-diphosphatase
VTWWQGAALGLVQGLTEFLPVSSSGHLVLAERLVGLDPPGVFVEVALHAATLVSVLVVYGDRLARLAGGVLRGQPADLRYAGRLVLASVPAGARAFDSLPLVGAALIVTGTLLWSTRRTAARRDATGAAGAAGIGVAQAFAILPGISRSGATVAAGLWLGLSPVRAAEFSFLMAVPAIAGALVLELRHLPGEPVGVGLAPLLLGCAVALASGIWSIRFLLGLLDRGRFYTFAPYCWAVGGLTLGVALWPR